MGKKTNLILLAVSFASYFIVALEIALLYLLSGFIIENSAPVLVTIFRICFWVFLLVGIFLQVALSFRVKKLMFMNKQRTMYVGKSRVGLIGIFSNLPAAVSDTILAVSLIVFLIVVIFTSGTGFIAYISLSVLFLSFCSHCIFNGKNYNYIVNCEFAKNSKTKNGGVKNGND